MAFVKLDCGILQSTIWFDRAAREVFLTALLLAEPAVFDEPPRQIEVKTLDYTGWCAPAGWYGYVPACGAAIIARAMVDQAEGEAALERLGSPEASSRSPEFDGRRLIRVDGGYLVLNYQKHRDKDHTTANRSRRYRERKAALASTSSHRDDVASRRDITQAEAEAEAYNPERAKSLSEPAAPVPDAIALVRSVFDEWRTIHGHPTSKLDAKRTARIRSGLKLRSAEELKLAVRGALKDDWLMGRDPKSPRKYDGLETILRDAAQIERLIELEAGRGTAGYAPRAPNASKQRDEGVDAMSFWKGGRK